MSCIGYDNNCICFNCIDLDEANSKKDCSGEFPCEASTAAVYLKQENKELKEINQRLKEWNKKLVDKTWKDFAKKETERANRNGQRASKIEVELMDFKKENKELRVLLKNIIKAQEDIDSARPDFTDQQIAVLYRALGVAKEALK